MMFVLVVFFLGGCESGVEKIVMLYEEFCVSCYGSDGCGDLWCMLFELNFDLICLEFVISGLCGVVY